MQTEMIVIIAVSVVAVIAMFVFGRKMDGNDGDDAGKGTGPGKED